MASPLFFTAQEVSSMLGVCNATAYKIIRNLNEELKSQGYVTVSGKINRKYFIKKTYGGLDDEEKSVMEEK